MSIELFNSSYQAGYQAGRAAELAFDFEAHLRRQREWSMRTFGPGNRTSGVVDHIRKELNEIERDPADVSEWIDVVILGLDGAWRAGFTPEQIIAALVAKQAKNEARNWPDWRTAPLDKAIEHDRTGEAHPLPPEAAPSEPTVIAVESHANDDGSGPHEESSLFVKCDCGLQAFVVVTAQSVTYSVVSHHKVKSNGELRRPPEAAATPAPPDAVARTCADVGCECAATPATGAECAATCQVLITSISATENTNDPAVAVCRLPTGHAGLHADSRLGCSWSTPSAQTPATGLERRQVPMVDTSDPLQRVQWIDDPATTGPEWQPIATAPKDGTDILMTNGKTGSGRWIRTGYWAKRIECWSMDAVGGQLQTQPRFWSPLPPTPPPASEEG